ncbi:hypothetical protein DCS_02911 [Drechmeria coniospora]|uniref:Uncharacterized protein n=1 Tax=Drechmeria coniospora TaxID=98403 RepID=A0A151GXD8_DRECN|nr:hypothetical protein DCS_02911 [Drechmeria coniospora]KYK61767.1 hypothetical protein DCS_02911 [Drechmeria coniospora]
MSLHQLAVRSRSFWGTRFGPKYLSTSRVSLRYSTVAPTPTTVVQSGFWKSLIPKPLRKQERGAFRAKSKEWNPATYFIVMFLFIGSMSIQMIALRKQAEQYARQSAVRIGLLREVVEKIKNGEEVDVEKILGTGDPQREADWEEGGFALERSGRSNADLAPVLKAIEQDETVRKPRKQAKAAQQEAQEKKKTTGRQKIEDNGGSEPQPTRANSANLGNFF